jgi:hypothetical protein
MHNRQQYKTKQNNAIQYNTIQYNTIQYNTIQYTNRAHQAHLAVPKAELFPRVLQKIPVVFLVEIVHDVNCKGRGRDECGWKQCTQQRK